MILESRKRAGLADSGHRYCVGHCAGHYAGLERKAHGRYCHDARLSGDRDVRSVEERKINKGPGPSTGGTVDHSYTIQVYRGISIRARLLVLFS